MIPIAPNIPFRPIRHDDPDENPRDPHDFPSFSQGDERVWVRAFVQSAGCTVCFVMLVWAFAHAFVTNGMSMQSSMPAYAQSLLYRSIGHQLDVHASAAVPPPPPPQF